MAPFAPLTPQQFQSAQNAGFSTGQIIQNEQIRKSQSQGNGDNNAGAWMTPSPNDSSVMAGVKTAANFIPSLINTGEGMVKSVVDLPGEIASIPGAAKAAFDANQGNLGETVMNTIKSLPGATLQTLEGILPFLKPAIAGDLSGVAQSIEANPVGNILPIVAGAEGGVRGLADRGVISDAIPKALDTGISKTAQVVTKPAEYLAGKATSAIGKSARFGASQVTGLDPSTIQTIKDNPSAFSKSAIQNTDRVSVARQVENGLQTRINDLSETGKGYSDIRKSVAPVRVDPQFLTNLFEKNTGLTVQEAPIKPTEEGVIQTEPQKITPGTLTSSPNATIRNAGDVSRLQKIYNTYQPLFESGTMTPNEFLNLRSDLADAANYESKNGKSSSVEAAASRMRGQLNDTYRPQIPGLQSVDDSFSGQIGELNILKKGLLDKDGNLTDQAINRIANATGKGRDILLGKLEQIIPGITKKIGIVKAIEDIEHTEGPKVGTYLRGGAEGAGFLGILMGHPIAGVMAIVTAIIASPASATQILRAYGATSSMTLQVLSQLKGYLNPSMSGNLSIPMMPRQMVK